MNSDDEIPDDSAKFQWTAPQKANIARVMISLWARWGGLSGSQTLEYVSRAGTNLRARFQMVSGHISTDAPETPTSIGDTMVPGAIPGVYARATFRKRTTCGYRWRWGVDGRVHACSQSVGHDGDHVCGEPFCEAELMVPPKAGPDGVVTLESYLRPATTKRGTGNRYWCAAPRDVFVDDGHTLKVTSVAGESRYECVACGARWVTSSEKKQKKPKRRNRVR